MPGRSVAPHRRSPGRSDAQSGRLVPCCPYGSQSRFHARFSSPGKLYESAGNIARSCFSRGLWRLRTDSCAMRRRVPVPQPATCRRRSSGQSVHRFGRQAVDDGPVRRSPPQRTAGRRDERESRRRGRRPHCLAVNISTRLSNSTALQRNSLSRLQSMTGPQRRCASPVRADGDGLGLTRRPGCDPDPKLTSATGRMPSDPGTTLLPRASGSGQWNRFWGVVQVMVSDAVIRV